MWGSSDLYQPTGFALSFGLAGICPIARIDFRMAFGSIPGRSFSRIKWVRRKEQSQLSLASSRAISAFVGSFFLPHLLMFTSHSRGHQHQARILHSTCQIRWTDHSCLPFRQEQVLLGHPMSTHTSRI
jgi:hypothetical protein